MAKGDIADEISCAKVRISFLFIIFFAEKVVPLLPSRLLRWQRNRRDIEPDDGGKEQGLSIKA